VHLAPTKHQRESFNADDCKEKARRKEGGAKAGDSPQGRCEETGAQGGGKKAGEEDRSTQGREKSHAQTRRAQGCEKTREAPRGQKARSSTRNVICVNENRGSPSGEPRFLFW
jgi:hypothetical protein